MKKVLITIMVIILSLNLMSCIDQHYYDMNQIKDEFSAYENSKNICIETDDELYFSDHCVDLDDLVKEGTIGAIGSHHENVIFAVSKYIDASDTFTLTIYECDQNGDNLRIIFSKDGYKSGVVTLYDSNIVFIEHYKESQYKQSGRIIDSYNLETGEYLNEDSGRESSLHKSSSLLRKYTASYQKRKDELIITKNSTGETFCVDHNKVEESVCGAVLSQYPYKIDKWDNYNGQIYVICNWVTTSYNGGWYSDFACVVFEVDFDNQKLEYKSFIHTVADMEMYRVIRFD